MLETERLILKPSDVSLVRALLDFQIRNRDFFRAFDPLRAEDFYSLECQRELLNAEAEQAAHREGYRFYIFPKEKPDLLIGTVGLSNIIRGVFLSCFMGYKIDQGYQSRGYMTEAVKAVCAFAFNALGLHRIECNIMPQNEASLRVAEKCGFVWEGLARKYLRINGVWEDHVHMARINEGM